MQTPTSGPRRGTDFLSDSILPPPPPNGEPVIHDREYRVRSYRLSTERMLVQGALRDQKAPGLLIPDDPDPITIHHMVVSLVVLRAGLVIDDVIVDFEAHPHGSCPTIVEHYDSLVGLSIARGFTHRVRELFGGPRGCSHTTALLQAMAPVAFQTVMGMEIHDAYDAGELHPRLITDRKDDSWRRLVGTCHVWADGGDIVTAAEAGEMRERPIPIQIRQRELAENEERP